MSDTPFIARGFHRRRAAGPANRLPPGQYETKDFPVLSAGPTPRVSLATWDFTLRDEAATRFAGRGTSSRRSRTRHPQSTSTASRSGRSSTRRWQGVSVDTLLAATCEKDSASAFVVAYCDGGYTTNLPLERRHRRQGVGRVRFDGEPLAPEHGGPARLLVPHCISGRARSGCGGFAFCTQDHPGFWEQLGYHNRGDPWQEQRYQGDS